MEGRGTGEKGDLEEPGEGKEGLAEMGVVGMEGEGLCIKGRQIVGAVYLTYYVEAPGIGSTGQLPT